MGGSSLQTVPRFPNITSFIPTGPPGVLSSPPHSKVPSPEEPCSRGSSAHGLGTKRARYVTSPFCGDQLQSTGSEEQQQNRTRTRASDSPQGRC